MTENTETKTTETVKEPEVKIEKVEPVKEPTLEELKEKLAEATQHAKNKEEEAARHFKKIQSFEQAEQAKKDAELSELDKEKKARAALEAENKTLKINQLKQSTASKLGLPEILANRLQGETPEEIEADAKQLLETLPKKTSSASATNPGAGAQVVKTDAEKLKEMGFG
jgi:predicted RNase H-like HicB family nuclease